MLTVGHSPHNRCISPLQISNRLQHPYHAPKGQRHEQLVLDEMVELERLGSEFGWENVKCVKVVGKNI